MEDALVEVGSEESLPMRAALARTRASLFGADVQPTRLGRFELLRVLGRGASGVVHRAHDPKLGRDVALKVYPKHADAELARRIKREARVSAGLDHPNIVTVFDTGEEGGRLWVAMELVEGETLRSSLAKGPKTWSTWKPVALSIARGIEAAHRLGVVHRDIKPENILLGADGRVAVADFGLAALAPTTAPGETSVTSAGGTPAYMSKKPNRFGATYAQITPDTFLARLCALVPPPRAHTVLYYGVLSAHHKLRFAVVPRPDEPEPPPKQLSLFIPRGQLEFPAITTLLHAQLRDAAPSRLPWMTLLARVFRVGISGCSRCCGPMRVTRAVTTPQEIAAELRGAPPAAASRSGRTTPAVLAIARSPLSLAPPARRFAPRSSRRACQWTPCVCGPLWVAHFPLKWLGTRWLSFTRHRDPAPLRSPALPPPSQAPRPYSSIPAFSHSISPKRRDAAPLRSPALPPPSQAPRPYSSIPAFSHFISPKRCRSLS